VLAKHHFARANLRLVVMLAREHDQGALPLADLIQEGNVGLMIAIERFDPDRGFRFSTYAGWWIRHAIRRAIADKASTVRVPVHHQDLTRQLAHASRRALARSGSPPSTSELARELGISERKVRDLEARPGTFSWSLDHPIGGGPNGTSFIDLLEDPATPADEVVAARATRADLEAFIAELQPLEARILERRFGLDGADPETLGSLGDELNLSRERVRQLQERAIARLRRRVEQAPALPPVRTRADQPETSA
jgi:RNA polymerase primary sigma factor